MSGYTHHVSKDDCGCEHHEEYYQVSGIDAIESPGRAWVERCQKHENEYLQKQINDHQAKIAKLQGRIATGTS